ncbi:MAG TPA: 50S ribosomal protein L11 methyltransferase [Terriglobia bacterium]|nr:50S ribosomal protein L11 methyltransferase [Terriglobia bacterium]
MSWNQLTVDVPDDLKDAVIGELSDDGVVGVWEIPVPESGVTRLLLYFEPRSNLEKVEKQVRTVFDRSSRRFPAISRSVVEECDWTGEWKKSYRSFPIGDDFFVIPSWEESRCPHDRLPIRIDPGQAFGTGTHETTQLTVEALERWIEPDQVVLDVGTGSGILAIVSRLLGAREVIACDIDPVAVQVAHANIERNAEAEVWTFSGSVDAVKSGSVRLVLGNLTADLIIGLFEEFDRVLEPHGIAIFSGILQEQREEICEVIERFGFTIHEELTRGEWLALIAEKHVA